MDSFIAKADDEWPVSLQHCDVCARRLVRIGDIFAAGISAHGLGSDLQMPSMVISLSSFEARDLPETLP